MACFTPAAYGGKIRGHARELEDHVRGRITCTFIYSPTEATRGHTAPNIMSSSPRINRGIDNIIDERYEESGQVQGKGGTKGIIWAEWAQCGAARTEKSVPKTPAEFPRKVPRRVTPLRMLFRRRRALETANGRAAPSRNPQRPPNPKPVDNSKRVSKWCRNKSDGVSTYIKRVTG